MSLNDAVPVFTSAQTAILRRDGVCQNILGGNFLHGQPCNRLDISLYMLNCSVFC